MNELCDNLLNFWPSFFIKQLNIREINIDFAQEDSNASLVAYFQWFNIIVVVYLCLNPFRLVVRMLERASLQIRQKVMV